jgi:hypothetical protein
VQSAADDDGWSAGQRRAPADRQPGVVRPAQLRLLHLTKLLAAIDLFEFADEGTSRVAVREKRRRQPALGAGGLDWAQPWFAPGVKTGEPVAARIARRRAAGTRR